MDRARSRAVKTMWIALACAALAAPPAIHGQYEPPGGPPGGGGDPGDLRFSAAGYNVAEAAGSATIQVERVGGHEGAVSVSYATAGGSATAGTDYAARTGTLSWGDGEAAPKSFTVPVTDDSEVELNETVLLVLSNPTGGADLAAPSQATLTIADDDSGPPPPPPSGEAGSLQFKGTSYSVAEGAGGIELEVSRTGGDAGAVSVAYNTVAGSAAAGEDFEAAGGTLSWGDHQSADKTVTVPIHDDAVAEGPETLSVVLAGPTGGARLGTPSEARIEIQDDDLEPFDCVPDATTACLLGGRFQMRVDWRRANGATGDGQVVPFTDQAVLLYFFAEENLEMLFKMVDGCGFNGHYWVFFGATTNVEFTVRVADSQTGAVRTYPNPLGMAAEPIQDIRAFATCP